MAAVLLWLVACSDSSAKPTASPSGQPATLAMTSTEPRRSAAPASSAIPRPDAWPPSTPTCDAATPIVVTSFGPEVQGVASNATVYGLVMSPRPGIRAGDEVKIVWRMTGEGDLSVNYRSPTNRPGVLAFGPELHGGSNYDRPGSEWGTGFLFDEPGCWRIHLERTIGRGDVWISVAPAGP
jgi:hypothetical protein